MENGQQSLRFREQELAQAKQVAVVKLAIHDVKHGSLLAAQKEVQAAVRKADKRSEG
jgi:hypothetical protein